MIDWYESEIDFNENWGDFDVDDVDFEDTDVVDRLKDIARDAGGDLGERKVSKAVTSTPFLDDFKSNSRKFQAGIISEIDRIEDFDSLDKIATGRKPDYRLVARQKGIELAKSNIRNNTDLENSADFLRKYNPQVLGGFRTQEIRRTKAFRELFGEEEI